MHACELWIRGIQLGVSGRRAFELKFETRMVRYYTNHFRKTVKAKAKQNWTEWRLLKGLLLSTATTSLQVWLAVSLNGLSSRWWRTGPPESGRHSRATTLLIAHGIQRRLVRYGQGCASLTYHAILATLPNQWPGFQHRCQSTPSLRMNLSVS